MEVTSFDKIAENFSSVIPETKKFIRAPLILKLVGDIKDKKILDVGCGDGFFTRLLAKKSPKIIVGIDLSKELIKKASSVEKFKPLNIKYIVGDVCSIKLKEKFDLVSSVYLFNYASSKSQLFDMIKSSFDCLENGGRLCSIVPHPNIIPMRDFEYGRKITSVNGKKKFEDGDILKCEIKNEDSYVEFNFYYWSRETYFELLKEAGFSEIYWTEPFISKKEKEKFGEKYWLNFLQKPSSIGFTCYSNCPKYLVQNT